MSTKQHGHVHPWIAPYHAIPYPITTTLGLAVRFDDVSFHYPEQRPEAGLKHVSFEIPPGTTTALVGSTGQSGRAAAS